jgi:peptidoglycan/LPS O-acetylase OafA/YrhL
VEVRDPEVFRKMSRPWVGIVGIGFIVVQTLLHHFPVALAAGIGTPLLIGWLAGVRVPYGRALAFAGGGSYAMYLWHKDLFLSFGIVGLPIALVGAALSWALVERPILALANGVAARWRQPAEPDTAVIAATT